MVVRLNGVTGADLELWGATCAAWRTGTYGSNGASGMRRERPKGAMAQLVRRADLVLEERQGDRLVARPKGPTGLELATGARG